MNIGYARVSTDDQDLSLQKDALNGAHCERILTDTETGSKAKRPGLIKALDQLRKDDVFIVWKLDRLGRSVKSLIGLIEDLESKGVEFKSLTEGIDTTTPAGRFFFHVMASLAQMERELIVERTQAGLKAARQRGRIGGRPRSMTEEKLKAAQNLIRDGMQPKDVARTLGVSVPTLYRWLPASAR